MRRMEQIERTARTSLHTAGQEFKRTRSMIVLSMNEHCSKTNPEIQQAFLSWGVTFTKNRTGKSQASSTEPAKAVRRVTFHQSHRGRHNTLVCAHRKYLLELKHMQPFPRPTLTNPTPGKTPWDQVNHFGSKSMKSTVRSKVQWQYTSSRNSTEQIW